jgi:hypothetical protein
MAYRTSARTQPGDTAVCCVRCGALTSIAFASSKYGDFRCQKCGHDQPVLPNADDLELRDVRFQDYAIGSYDELTPFAKEFGKDVVTSGLELVCDGIACKLGINVNSGTVTGLDHFATTTGFPFIRFLNELPSHVEAKASGVAMEVQTGDSDFDDQVYIESPASEADVLTVLSSPAVRKAIRMLLSDAGAVGMAHDGVAFYVSRQSSPFDPPGIRQRLRWLRIVAGAPRPLVEEPVVVPARARLSKSLVGWLSPLGVFLFVLGLAKWTPNSMAPVIGGFAAGVVLAVLMLPVWKALLRGRSTSHREVFTWRLTTFAFAPILVAGLLLTINGAFDGSSARTVGMPIVNVSKDSEDETWHATTKDDEGDTHSYTFSVEPKVGQTVEVQWRSGALGWTWETGTPSVIGTTKP